MISVEASPIHEVTLSQAPWSNSYEWLLHEGKKPPHAARTIQSHLQACFAMLYNSYDSFSSDHPLFALAGVREKEGKRMLTLLQFLEYSQNNPFEVFSEPGLQRKRNIDMNLDRLAQNESLSSDVRVSHVAVVCIKGADKGSTGESILKMYSEVYELKLLGFLPQRRSSFLSLDQIAAG